MFLNYFLVTIKLRQGNIIMVIKRMYVLQMALYHHIWLVLTGLTTDLMLEIAVIIMRITRWNKTAMLWLLTIVLEIIILMDTQCQWGKNIITSKITTFSKLFFSDYQALPREYASYPYEQHSNIQYPHYQAYPAQEPECRHDA